jgi:cell division protein FtsQ
VSRRGRRFDIGADLAPAQQPELLRDIERQRRLAGLLVAASVLIVLALAARWWLLQPEHAIKRLRVEGALERVNPTVLRTYAVGRLHGGLYAVDLDEARRVFEQVPWVRRAVVRRLWPNALLVEVEEHRPVAFWGDEGDQTLLNEFGEVFVANTDEVSDGLPRLIGPPGEALAMLDMLRRLNRRLQGGDWAVEQLSLDERREWEVDLNNGLQLLLGRDDARLWQRVDRLLATHQQAERALHAWTQGRLGRWVRIDLRHEQGYAVAAEPGAADAAAHADVAPAQPRRDAAAPAAAAAAAGRRQG